MQTQLAQFVEFDIHDETILHSSRAPELILLAAIRAWLRPFCAATGRMLRWRDILCAAVIDVSGIAHFDRMMRAVLLARPGLFEVRCRCCATLGVDEAGLLTVIAQLQRSQYAEAVSWFAERLPKGSAEELACNAWRVAEAFADAGLIVALADRDVTYLQ